MTLRHARHEDLPAIVAILNQSAGTGANALLAPVSTASREAWLAEHTPDRQPVWVAESGGALLGWCSLSGWRSGRGALAGVREISYYVDAAHYRQGVATALVRHAVATCPGLAVHTLLAIGLETNSASEALLAREGFVRWGLLPAIAHLDRQPEKVTGQWIYGRHL